MNLKGVAAIGIGLMILLFGIAMPATTTHNSRTCVDSTYEYGDGCVNAEYQTGNPAKIPFIIFGLMLTIVGGVLTFKRNDSGSTVPQQSQQETPQGADPVGQQPQTAEQQDTQMLEEQINQYQESNPVDSESEKCPNCHSLVSQPAIYCSQCGAEIQ